MESLNNIEQENRQHTCIVFLANSSPDISSQVIGFLHSIISFLIISTIFGSIFFKYGFSSTGYSIFSSFFR